MSKLYELAEGYINLMDLADNEEVPVEIIKEGLKQIEGDIEDKVTNMVRLIKNMEGDAEIIKAEEKRLADRRKAYENKVKGVKEYIKYTLNTLEMDKVKTPFFTVAIQNNAPSVIVADENLLEDKYFIVERKLDKKSISDALKQGIEVKGAVLKQTRSLRIR